MCRITLLRAEGRTGAASATEAVQTYALRATAGNSSLQRDARGRFIKAENANSYHIRIGSLAKDGGTSTAYLTARLKRDAPAIAADLAQGKYRSVG